MDVAEMDQTLENKGLREWWEPMDYELPKPNPENTDTPCRHFGPFDGLDNRTGPHHWRLKPIPWAWIVAADNLGQSGAPLRVGLMVHALTKAYRATHLNPARICADDSDHVGTAQTRMGEYLTALAGAGLITLDRKRGRKYRVLPTNPVEPDPKWMTPRGLWWPAVSHLANHSTVSAVLGYLFLSIHYDFDTETAVVPKNLAGWTRTRRDFERAMAELRAQGLVVREKIRVYRVPTLFRADPAVDLKPGWMTPITRAADQRDRRERRG